MTDTDFGSAALERARERVARAVHRTPLLHSRTLSERLGVPVHLKCENLQKTGAFKVRGALNRLLTLSEEERARGVATISAGNHAQAVAWAASAAGVRSLVVMPEHASPIKVRASRAYGAEVVLHGDAAAAFERVFELAEERGLTFVHPFDDPDVIAGHAGVGLEILEDASDVESVIVPVGGGGLIGGVAAAVKTLRPAVEVVGVEPTGADVMTRSLASGRVETLQTHTVADGLAAPFVGEHTLRHAQAFVDRIVRVEDQQILEALALLWTRCKLAAEPSAAASLAALLSEPERFSGRSVVCVVSGGNVDRDVVARALGAGTSP